MVSSTSSSSSLLPPSGFSPPTNAHNRKSRTAIVLTASTKKNSLSASQSVLSPPRRDSHSLTKKHQQDSMIMIVDNNTDYECNNRNKRSYGSKNHCDQQLKGLLREGPPPPIASITADLDLAAKEEQNCINENQDTLKEIDAVVAGNSGDHEDDTDLGFVFERTTSRNDDCHLRSNKDGHSQNRSVGESSSEGSENQKKNQSLLKDSLLMPSPPKPSLFRERTVKQQSRQNYHSSSHMNHQQFSVPPPFAPYPPGPYPSSRHSSMQQQHQNKYSRRMPHPSVDQRLPPPPHVRTDTGYNQHHQPAHSFGFSNSYYHPNIPNSHNNSMEKSTNGGIKINDSDKANLNKILASPHRMKENIDIRYDEECMEKGKQKADRIDSSHVSLKTKTLLRSPPVKKRRVVGSWDEGARKKDVDLMPIGSPSNVFRSPKRHTKRSPIATNDSISYGGSFEIVGSPSSKLDDMFPPSNSFEFGETIHIGNDDSKFMLTNSMSEDDIILPSSSTKRDVSHKKHQSSPCLMFDSVLSPFRRSPPKYTPSSGRRKVQPNSDIFGVFDASPISERRPVKSIQKSNSISMQPIQIPKRHMLPTKHIASENNVHRFSPVKDNPPFASPGSFRFQIGTIGETRKEIEGINSVVNRRLPQVGQFNQSSNRPSSQTPIKAQAHIVSTPSTGMKMSRYPGSSSRQGIPLTGPRPRYINTSVTPTSKKSKDGKENESPVQRRNPCNCKKSNCLKLYCVCFQSKLYCDGCNCNDCNNTKEKEEIRLKAIKDTIAKNPNAFKTKFSTKQESLGNGSGNSSPAQGHNMGCKCKKSQCLKKYCECFEAGVICSEKCKCIECQNFVGSQQLIDRRRKIKDHKGAEMAMRSSHDAWKHGLNPGMRNVMRPHGAVFPSPAPRMGQPPTIGLYSMSMISPPPGGMHPASVPPPFMNRSQMMMAPMGYSPIGMQPITPYSSNSAQPILRDKTLHRTSYFQQRPTLAITTPRNHAARKGFDPHSIKKRNGKNESSKHYFGPGNAAQTKTTALTVFSFLSNDDIYNASLVSHTWSKLCLDEELWQFEETSRVI